MHQSSPLRRRSSRPRSRRQRRIRRCPWNRPRRNPIPPMSRSLCRSRLRRPRRSVWRKTGSTPAALPIGQPPCAGRMKAAPERWRCPTAPAFSTPWRPPRMVLLCSTAPCRQAIWMNWVTLCVSPANPKTATVWPFTPPRENWAKPCSFPRNTTPPWAASRTWPMWTAALCCSTRATW